MPDNVFVDSNIFIYAKVKSQDPTKHLCAKNFLRTLDEQVFISVQVLNEFYNTLVRLGIDDHTIQNSLKDICNRLKHNQSANQQSSGVGSYGLKTNTVITTALSLLQQLNLNVKLSTLKICSMNR